MAGPRDEEGFRSLTRKIERDRKFGCANYKETACDFVVWDKPLKQPCPQCGAPRLLEKTTKRDGTVRYCKNEDCDYKMAVATEDVTADSTAGKEAPTA